MFLGIDIGTSSIKSILIDRSQRIIGATGRALKVHRPRPGWSEQNPRDWWDAVVSAVDELKSINPGKLSEVEAIGLSGQMHGATLLDRDGNPVRPCILWNDGRSEQQCHEFEISCPQSREISGNIAMPGFTAPKLLWVRENEPRNFDAVHKVLLPKDYVRYRLTGDFISDMSDSAGTLWLDTARRRWSDRLLAASGLVQDQMPALVEGSEAAGRLRDDFTRRWGMKVSPVVAGGAGDNAASACGIGAVNPGDAFISLGTSGVIFVSNASFAPNTDGALHAFCHAVPDSWHQMGVILSAASCFDWLAHLCGCEVSDIYGDLETSDNGKTGCLFLPYLSGERTPHNLAAIRGLFAGIDNDTGRGDLSHAVASGVGYAFRDCLEVLAQAGTRVEQLTAVGGGARSGQWLQILSNVLNRTIVRPVDAGAGAAFGAARLAMAAVSGSEPQRVMQPAAIESAFEPDTGEAGFHEHNWARYRALFPATKEALAE